MNLSNQDYLNHLYTCRRHGGELYASPAPAICPVCHKPTIKRHPKFYEEVKGFTLRETRFHTYRPD